MPYVLSRVFAFQVSERKGLEAVLLLMGVVPLCKFARIPRAVPWMNGPRHSLFDRRTRLCAMGRHGTGRDVQCVSSENCRTGDRHITQLHSARLGTSLHRLLASKIFAAEKRIPRAIKP